MLNSTVLDIVIGLVFIYLLYSLLVTTIQEIIASNFGFRAKILQRAVFRMLEDDNKFNSKFRSVLYLFKKSGNGGEKNSTSYEFYKHPLIRFLGESDCHGKPAYINKETFSKVIIDLLRGDQVNPGDDIKLLIQKALDEKTTSWGNAKISDETVSYLKSIWADADGDIKRFKGHLENWFDETMDRASGWYKKHTQFILFFVGLTIAILFNVDTIKIVDKLEKDPKIREQLVQQAEEFDKAHPDLEKQLFLQKAENEKFLAQYSKKEVASNKSLQNKQSEDSLVTVNYLNIQARKDTLLNRADLMMKNDIKKCNDVLGLGPNSYDGITRNLGTFVSALAGWIITALALSLGAPFWFDLLNKLMKLRGSVATPTSDNKEKQQG